MMRSEMPSYPDALKANGDHRLIYSAVSGRNTYGCTVLPNPEVLELGSCSGSTPEVAMDEPMRALFETLAQAHEGRGNDYLDFETECFDRLRQRLLQVLGLNGSKHAGAVDIAFSASGTDCELLATSLALAAAKSGRLCNLIVGAGEVGSRTLPAAAGQHFTEMPPFAAERLRVGVGQGITGFPPVAIEEIHFRDECGMPLPLTEIDDAISQKVRERIRSGMHVLLHVNACSKTGMFGPSINSVMALTAAYPSHITVVVDAAQGRFSRKELHLWLDAGWLVSITGSKFFGGPSFSGALFIPKCLAQAPPLPSGLSDYFCPAELPATWTEWRKGLPPRPALGRLLRWEGAISCMERYYALPDTVRHEILAAFASMVGDALANFRSLHVMLPPPEWGERSSFPYSTIIPVAVRRYPSMDILINAQQHKTLMDWLILASGNRLPETGTALERESLDARFHLGQPVCLNPHNENQLLVSRIALGAPLVIRLATDLSLGPDRAERYRWLRKQMGHLGQKIDTLMHLDLPPVPSNALG